MAIACVGALLLSACGDDDGPGKVGLYDRAPVPAVPDRTAAVVEPIADGDYWAELVDADDGAGTLTFDVMQALFAQTCLDTLGEDGCPNDYGVIDDPHLELVTPAASIVSPTVVNDTQQNFAITGEELGALVTGLTPADAAPDDYFYVPFPFLVTVRGGVVVEAHQIWVP